MSDIDKYLSPNRDDFGKDPFGYSALAWHRWGIAQTLAGFNVDITKPPTSEDLKSPVLWLSQAHALSQSALILLRNEPDFKIMPREVRGVCDSQYCAVGLMLVGYSLEICLKAIIIMKQGVAAYVSEEKKHKHHRLEELASFIPNLNDKDKAILKVLTYFIYWAGRYPDPGSGREDEAENIFSISEKFEISSKDLFEFSARIMSYSRYIANSS